MTDRELKKMIKNAYYQPQSEGRIKFLKEHEKRSRQLSDVLKNEFCYMGLKSVFSGMILCALLIVVLRKNNENMIWVVSSIIPICAAFPMNLILRSERYGMCEIEAASRFSLRFIRLIRMFILGSFSSAVILCASIVLRKQCSYGILDIVMYMLLPYFVSIWGCLIIARKWRGKEIGIGILLIGISTGLLPTVLKELRRDNITSDYVYVAITVIIMIVVVKECINYINERLDLSWN